MLIPYLKKIALFGIISIFFTGHVNSQTSIKNSYGDRLQNMCIDGQIPVLRDVQNPDSFITCVSEEILGDTGLPKDKFKLIATSEDNYNKAIKSRFNRDKTIEWFVIGFVMTIIIAIMSILISLLWRFKFKISAYLFGIVTLLSVIAVPFIFYL
ncbi:hypothetical protein [Bartonella raoultii]|uniref:Uncharacterized protein n=1 Tax=Bartonella raoultii TaxID=1457020 RepID=A0ABS7I5E9_9HYPH|nr:hypothetical protein [Bartonella raoultii]MBX4335590.1 hypothetical protein [Bartonella raoultii]